MSGNKTHRNRRPARLLSTVVACGLLWASGPAANALETDAEQPTIPEAEKTALLQVGYPQARAVIWLNEALMTAHALRRAEGYLAAWGEPGSDETPWVPADVQRLETQLQALEGRFFVLYQAHFGPTADRKREPVPLTSEAKRLAADAEARAVARDRLLADYRACRDEARGLLHHYRSALTAVREKAAHTRGVPRFEPTPRFVKKPAATLLPDGTPTGIIVGLAEGTTPPGTLLQDFDFESGCYEKYDTDYRISPIRVAQGRRRRTQIIVPCAVHGKAFIPHAWFREHRNEPIHRAFPGLDPNAWRGEWMWPLDFHHPSVRDMLEGYLTEVGKRYRGNAQVIMHTTAWEATLNDGSSGEWGKWPTGGRAPAGVASFRRYLQEKFGTIEALNEAWGSDYEDFEAIEPPPDVFHGPQAERAALVAQLHSGRCPPLYYEFNRFLKDSYADYLAWCYRLLKAADPTHPITVSPSYGSLDGYLCTGRDSFVWAEGACDIYGSEANASFDEVFNWSIQRALDRATGIFECIWNSSENWSNPPEEVVRAAGRRNLWRMVAWGRSVLTLYGSFDTYGGSAYNNMLVYESGYRILRRSAGLIGPLKHKLRSMEDVWLDAPVIQPRIAMLKPSASQICGWPYDAVTGVSADLHNLLYQRNYHYAFVPEEYLLSGRETLDGFRVLILPYATHFPPGLTEKILPWIESGGTLIIAGIAGGFTPYGQVDGELMKEVFGQLRYQPWHSDGRVQWMITAERLRPGVADVGPNAAEIFVADYGQGKALMAAGPGDLRPGGAAAELACELLDQADPRMAWAEGAELEMVLREDTEGLHMVLINPSSKEPAEATIHLAQDYQSAVDRGIEGGFPVPLRKERNGQVFDVSLAPGEGTMIDLGASAGDRR